MKRLFSICLMTMAWVYTTAQTTNLPIEFDENGGFSKVIEVKATAKQAFQYSRAFFSNRIKNYKEAVEIEDPEANKIQVRDKRAFKENAAPLPSQNPESKRYFLGYEQFKLTIECKDNKIRVKVENSTFDYNTYLNDVKMSRLPPNDYKLMLRLVSDKEEFLKNRSFSYKFLIEKLVKYIEEQVKEEDF